MRISDWSSDVCSSDLRSVQRCRGDRSARDHDRPGDPGAVRWPGRRMGCSGRHGLHLRGRCKGVEARQSRYGLRRCRTAERSEEHTSELQSLMRISYAVFCLKKKIIYITYNNTAATIYTLYTINYYYTL